MASCSRETYNKILRMVEVLRPEMKKAVKKVLLPEKKMAIQFCNRVSEEDGGNKSRRKRKPNVQEKRLFSYVHDRHIDKAGGIWKANIERADGDSAAAETK